MPEMGIVVIELDVGPRGAVGSVAELGVLETDVALCVVEVELLS